MAEILIDTTPLFIHHITMNVLNELKLMAERKSIALEASLPTYYPYVADADGIHKVITVLVDNAIRYTPEGGKVEILGSENEHEIKLIVKDNGIGIEQKEQDQIFEEFFQIEDIMGHKDGFGLGLSIAKRIIKLHGGRIWVESIPKKGSTFFFTLPKIID